MSVSRTADSYAYQAIYNCLMADAALIELFDGNAPQISWKMPVRQASMPFIVFYSKMHDAVKFPYQKEGRIYFSVYDYSQSTTRSDQIVSRICSLLRMRGFPSIPGIISGMRIFQNSMIDSMPTDSETVLRYDISFPAKWCDELGMLEKLTRTFPQIS